MVKLDPYGNASRIALYRHKCYRELTWNEISKVDTNRPIIFSAEGSHASYERAGHQGDTCSDFHGSGNLADDNTAAGYSWRTWTWLADVERQPWFGFGGAWGTTGETTWTTGPLGPGVKSPAPMY